ncbi:carbohydrate ABC transporter permease [Streptomyces radicis]|uniref:Carbohydrate ABC transporter permease n=1 Tax=Streptomyces radicis TaxID=1750517 RepID=A0A3A9WKW9_9ACTN|nr:carbohydrate ABC transporter permease [Streptomyces radicis]RKN08386.1 carbohydrate ABC transporter permease [Streptomyces radicis]RKN21579.1 carbohydrate ABC transporter permease [Streptomyces radicis]
MSAIATPHPAARGLKGIVLLIACALVVLPFLSVVSTSLADPEQVAQAGGFVLWPEHPTLEAYRAVFAGDAVTQALLVSTGITVVGTVLSLTCTAMLAYALSRPGSFGAKPMLLTVLFTLLFSPGMIPSYLMVKQLGLLDSYWSLILPVLINGFNVIVMRAFFMDLPGELMDSARIDGASELTILLRIVLPLSKAVLAVIGLFYAVAYWNSFFTALLYMNDTTKWPLQLVLRTYVVNGANLGGDQAGATEVLPPQQSLQMAILVISIVPILLVYPFLQRHFAKGVLVGAVKG